MQTGRLFIEASTDFVPPLKEAWMDKAACLSKDPELFFADHPNMVEKAKEVCNTQCKVRLICLQKALDQEGTSRSRYGVRGGYTGKERDDKVQAMLRRAQ